MENPLLELIASRRSIRKYSDRRPERTLIEKLVQAACMAPSNHNRQGWKFVVFEDREEIVDLVQRVRQSVAKSIAYSHRMAAERADEILHFSGAFDQAPVLILAMHKKSPALGRSLLAAATSPLASGEILSTAMAIENILLAAHALGLGACVMTAPLLAGDVWTSLADLPIGFEPTCLVTLGYPAENPSAPQRKSLEHVLEYRDHK
jgi:coenzyme F420-0:L-glutamate ligase / coenzyme F420-1:gamma-L-glutamate ligase